MPRKIAKKIFATALLLGLTFAIVVVSALFSSPWWIGTVAVDLAKEYDVEISSYETLSFGKIAFEDIRYDDGEGLTASIERVELPTPPVILLARFLGQFAPGIAVYDVKVVDSGPGSTDTSTTEAGAPTNLPQLINEYNDLAVLASDWFESITVTDIVYRESINNFIVPEARLAFWQLEFQLIPPILNEPLAIELILSPERNAEKRVLNLTVTSNDAASQIATRITVEPRELKIAGGIIDNMTKITFKAEWNEIGIIPLTAEVTADNFQTGFYKLSNNYEEPNLDIKATWADSKYIIQVIADVKARRDGYTTLNSKLKASGDFESITIETLQAEGGWLNVNLSNPVSITFDRLEDIPDAKLTLEANFSQQQLLPLKGTLDADLVVKNRGENLPLVSADWKAQALVFEEYPAADIEGKSQLDWPTMTFDEVIASTEDGSRIELDAKANFYNETLESATAKGEVGLILAQSLGLTDITYATLNFDIEASGPFQAPKHNGKANVTSLTIGQDSFDSELSWTGEALRFSEIEIAGEANKIDFAMKASADIDDTAISIGIQTASIKVEDYAELTLTEAFNIKINQNRKVHLSRLALDSTAGGHFEAECSLNWPESGMANVSASNVSAIWLGLFLESPLPFPTKLESLSMNANWDKGPIVFDLNANFQGGPVEHAPFQIAMNVKSDGKTTQIERLSASQDSVVLMEATGIVPVEFNPMDPKFVILESDEAADFKLKAKPGATAIWQWLEELSGVKVTNPYLDLVLEGSLTSPKGYLSAGFDKIIFSETTPLAHIPDVDDVKVLMNLSPSSVQVENLTLSIADHPLTAKAELPMTTAKWRSLVEAYELPGVENLTAELDFQEVPISAFDDFLPPAIRTNGSISVTGDIKPGFKWTGRLNVDGVETRPIQPIGALKDITADLELSGTTLTIQKAKANVGGREVTIAGTIGIDDIEKPDYDLTIQGQNIPFVRSPGLIMRGTPDLTLTTNERGATTLGGSIDLNESFYTVDLTALGQGGGGGDPNSRFPYFSVTDEPFARWRLDVEITGNDFLRVRTPVFEGKVTADFELNGRLQEPFAFGQASIGKGVVMFPFANFRVQNGTVTVTQDDPYNPQLDVTATSRAYGYDLTMRLTGTPDDPQLTFTSTPSLEPGDILLMVTAGQIPDDDSRSSQSRLAGLGIFVGNTILVDLGLVDPLDDRLQVYIAEDVSESGRDTIRVIYRINELWALVGQYDRFDAYTLDLKWTIYED